MVPDRNGWRGARSGGLVRVMPDYDSAETLA